MFRDKIDARLKKNQPIPGNDEPSNFGWPSFLAKACISRFQLFVYSFYLVSALCKSLHQCDALLQQRIYALHAYHPVLTRTATKQIPIAAPNASNPSTMNAFA